MFVDLAAVWTDLLVGLVMVAEMLLELLDVRHGLVADITGEDQVGPGTAARQAINIKERDKNCFNRISKPPLLKLQKSSFLCALATGKKANKDTSGSVNRWKIIS